MNSLVFFPEERSGSTIRLLGERARTVSDRHAPKVGVKIPIGEWGGMRGHGVFTVTDDVEVTLEAELTEPPLVRTPVEIVCAVARPQTVKKVIHAAVTCGVSALHFVRSSEVEKSYFQSSALGAKEIQEELLLGLEQACDTVPPEVLVHERFKPFVEDVLAARLAAESDPIALLLDTESSGVGDSFVSQVMGRVSRGSSRAFCAIGPERGWSSYERETFLAARFAPLSLGPRVLRVETAVTAASLFLSELFRRAIAP